MDDARATITKLHDDDDISSALLSLHSSCSLTDVGEGCTEAIAAVFTASLTRCGGSSVGTARTTRTINSIQQGIHAMGRMV